MGTAYWFCPENDGALAAGIENYTPPKAAAALRRGGARLPELWTGPDDITILENSRGTYSYRRDELRGYSPMPWGWSLYSSHILQLSGFDPLFLPDKFTLAGIRRLSHRHTSIEVLRHIGYDPRLMPAEVTDDFQAVEAIRHFGGDAVVKMPWSCSGRGVFLTAGQSEEMLRQRIKGIIRRQGCAMIEPRYERLNDFATLFYLSRGKAKFCGLSAFATDDAGHYTGNIIAPQSEIAALIGVDLTPHITALEEALSEIIGTGYEGWAGVDMLSYRQTDGSIGVAPCIEVNLRMTMGVAALLGAEAGKLPWPRALLRVALPGETLPPDALTFSLTPPASDRPLTSPTVIAAKI